MNVALIGASNNPERYAYKAFKRLTEKGHRVFLVHPTLKEIEGQKVYTSIQDIQEPLDTVTLYVSKDVSSKLASDILQKKPRRLILNPGAENPDLELQASKQGIIALNACTLVMLSTNQFSN